MQPENYENCGSTDALLWTKIAIKANYNVNNNEDMFVSAQGTLCRYKYNYLLIICHFYPLIHMSILLSKI